MADEVRVAVFDLNGTLYNKSSKSEFFKFICSKRKSKVLKIFYMGLFRALEKLHLINQTEFKENFFSYLDQLPPQQVDAYAKEFWAFEYPAYFNKQLMDRITGLKKEGVKIYCITGALDIYARPLFSLYKDVDDFAGTCVQYIDKKYKIMGEACKGEIKIKELEKMLGTKKYRVVEAYSDIEEEILDVAEKSFLVKEGKIIPYK